MKAAYEQYEQIERYLKAELSGSERAAFESRLETDALFSEEVKHHRAVHDLIIDQGLLELKAKMKAYDAGYTDSNNKLHIVSTIVLVASLTAIGLITSGNNTQPPVHSAIMATAPEGNSDNPAVADQIEKTKERSPMIIPAPSQATAVVSDSIQAEADTVHTTLQPLIFSPDTTMIKRSFRDEILQKDVIPEMKKPLEVPIPEPVHCQLESSTLKFSASESCASSPTGMIAIDKASSFEGKPPVAFSIDGKNYYPGYTFNSLYPGTYYLSVRDAHGCTWHEAKAITVEEKDCSEHEYSFYPDQGEVWKFPVSASSSGKIDIYNRNGSLVYTSAISHGHPDQWDGTANGHALPMGSYSFILKADGKVIRGYVTLFK